MMVRIALRWPLLLATALCLIGCGGGGGGSSPPPPPPPVAQTISFATSGAIAKFVGDAPFTNTASGGAGTGAITYSSSNPAVATVGADSGTVTVIAAGSAVITANKAASAGFLAADATYTVNVAAPVAQTISFATAGPVDKFVGDAPFTNTASGGAGTGAITYSSSNPAAATVGADSGTVTVIAAGSTVITANKAASAGFLAASATYTVNVAAPATQVISFSAPGPIARTFGDPPFTNTAAGGSGTGAITYSSDTLAVATVDANTSRVTIVGAGTARITATKAASPGFLAASIAYDLNVARASQTLTFNYAGPLSKRPSDSPMINPARGGAGTGAVTYTSSNPSVVTVVASSGEVRFVTAGDATITANKAQSANHLAASATYLINVHAPVIEELVAWIGETDTQAQFPAAAVGAEFMRSGLNCSVNSFDSCPLAPVSTLATANVLDAQTSTFLESVYALRRNGFTTRPSLIDGFGYYPTFDNEVIEENGTLWSLNFNLGSVNRSNDGRAWSNSSPQAPVAFEAREGAAATGHDNKIWVIGGNQLQATLPGSTTGEKADVFMIDTQGGAGFVTSNAAFGPRKFHRVTSFNGRLWLIGGQRGATPDYLNDVWSSSDGSTWTLATGAAPFPPRAEHALAVFNGRLWVIQGRNASGYLKDVWSTADGTTWRAENQFGNWGRAGHRAVVHNGRLYVIGTAEFLDYDYSTADGVTWQNHDPAGRPQLTRAAVVRFKNRLWIFGGKALPNEVCCARGDVWSSADADTWQFENLGAPYSTMPGPKMVEFNGELFLNGSSSWLTSLLQKLYKTSDGIHWSEAAPPPIRVQPEARSESALLTFNNRLWVLGGRNLEPYRFNSPRGDVYSTADGGDTWTEENRNAFLPRYGHSGYAIGGRMFVLGGYNDLTEQMGDIHSTADGANWREDVATVTNIGLRSYHETVVFNNRVWLLGGEKDGTSVTSQIWSSADGITWQLESANEPATARKQFGAVVWNGRIWVAGGKNAAGQVVADVWSSADGVNWRLETQSAIPTPRARMALAVFDNKLYMFGGESTRPDDAGRGINEMWSSADGVTWRRLYRNDVEVP
jgi:uncharacterized protein YjdB/N-acetylneuraminic acid mutarotase